MNASLHPPVEVTGQLEGVGSSHQSVLGTELRLLGLVPIAFIWRTPLLAHDSLLVNKIHSSGFASTKSLHFLALKSPELK